MVLTVVPQDQKKWESNAIGLRNIVFLIVELEKGEIKKASLRRIFASDGLMVAFEKLQEKTNELNCFSALLRHCQEFWCAEPDLVCFTRF